MRLQVEMTTASFTSGLSATCSANSTACDSVKAKPLAQRHGRGLVGDAERQQLACPCDAAGCRCMPFRVLIPSRVLLASVGALRLGVGFIQNGDAPRARVGHVAFC